MPGEGGFGGGSWGGGPWGSSGGQNAGLAVVSELVVISESLVVTLPFDVVAAASLSATLVRVDFKGFVAPDAPGQNAFYTIPGLTVLEVKTLSGSPKSVILRTSTQLNVSYTLTVNPAVLSQSGDAVGAVHNTATFTGLAPTASFTAVAQSRRKILLTFSETINLDAALVSPINYELASLKGEGVIITGIQQTGPDNTRAYLTVATDLESNAYYSLKVLPNVRTLAGKFLLPDQVLFQWKESRATIRIPITSFSGGVSTGLLGTPSGQAFFSPALDVSVSNSTIQIDNVSVCTRAYDVYTMPALPGSVLPLFTWPPPSGTTSEIGASGGILNALAHHLGLPLMALQNRVADTMPEAADGPATATLVETINTSRASFLNDDRWRTHPGTGATMGPFILADNLTYIGPGPTVTIQLQP